MKELVKQIDKCSVYKVSYMTRFSGCQCYKDCNCYDDWRKRGNPKMCISYNVFTGKKTHPCKNLEEALILAQKVSELQKSIQ